MTEDEAEDWAIEFERSNTAPHLFSANEQNRSTLEEMYGGMKKSDFDQLPPEQRLAIFNQWDYERTQKKN